MTTGISPASPSAVASSSAKPENVPALKKALNVQKQSGDAVMQLLESANATPKSAGGGKGGVSVYA